MRYTSKLKNPSKFERIRSFNKSSKMVVPYGHVFTVYPVGERMKISTTFSAAIYGFTYLGDACSRGNFRSTNCEYASRYLLSTSCRRARAVAHHHPSYYYANGLMPICFWHTHYTYILVVPYRSAILTSFTISAAARRSSFGTHVITRIFQIGQKKPRVEMRIRVVYLPTYLTTCTSAFVYMYIVNIGTLVIREYYTCKPAENK